MSYFPPSTTASFYSHSHVSNSLPPTPLHAPLLHSHNHLPPTSQLPHMRLLMPTVRIPRTQSPVLPSAQAPRSPRLRPTTNKLIRTRSGSVNEPIPTLATLPPSPGDVGMQWLGKACKFEIVQEHLQIEGYQMYAVEKWIVERTRPVTVLVVYTGDPSHKITVTALRPLSTLSALEARVEWESALHHLRRDGARPKETPEGTLHTTSLAYFRSDLTIVPIPQGDFLAVKDQLYANIGLLRMGCSGRSAVGLGDVSETTKDRFLNMYHLPDTSAHTHSIGKSKSKSKSRSHSNSMTLSVSQTQSLALSQTTSPTDMTSVVVAVSRGKTQTRAKDRTLFNATVLELVRLIQAALAISGMFPMPAVGGLGGGVEMDGLLCDVTVVGIEKWVGEVGESCLGVEPMERVADPGVVSALLSVVLATRNKLAAIGYSQVVPKDPFLHPQVFCNALTVYSQSIANMPTSNTNSSPFHTPHIPFHALRPHSQSQSTQNLLTLTTNSPVYLTLPVVNSIAMAFAKTRPSDTRKMHRVLLNKLDDIATDFRGGEVGHHGVVSDEEDSFGRGGRRGGGAGRKGGGSDKEGAGGQLLSGIGSLASGLGLSGGPTSAAACILEPTTDLAGFASTLAAGEKGRDREWEKDMDESGEGRGTAGSLKGLWSGRVGIVVRMREREREKYSNVSTGGRKADSERERGGLYSDGDTDGGKTTEDETDLLGGRPWSGRMQKKIESWTKLSRPKKVSMDLSKINGGIVAPPMSNDSSSSPAHRQHGAVVTSPTLTAVASGDTLDDEELLSSGQVSPIYGAHPFILGAGENSTPNLYHRPSQEIDNNGNHPSVAPSALGSISDYERRVSAFNRKRPSKGGYQSRVPSWSDPVSARNMMDEDNEMDAGGSSRSRSHSGSRLARFSFGANGEDVILPAGAEDGEHRKRLVRHGARRRHSFHDLSFDHVRVILPERMRIDVGLCGQFLAMRRREEHLDNILACLQSITSSLAATNASLHDDYHSHEQALSELALRAQVIAHLEAERAKTDSTTQERNTLLYESEQFRVQDLWHMASPPRQKVLDLREKVFGNGGRRLPNGVRGAHGRFNRVQWTLDGGERLVDLSGRTESEVEEEEGLEGLGIAVHVEEEDDVVENPRIKPMWLLRFFTSWGTRWSSPSAEPDKPKEAPQPKADDPPAALTSANDNANTETPS